MNQKRFTNITLIVVIVAIIIAGVYFVFTKQYSVTQTQPSASFTGKWEVVSVQEGGIQIVPEGKGATIEFFRDGTLKASGGCNEMMPGSYEIQADSKLSLSIGGTKRGCANDVVKFWDLNKVHTYEFTDNILFLHYKTDGGVEGSFKLLRLLSN